MAVKTLGQLAAVRVDVACGALDFLELQRHARLAERLRPYGLKWIEDCLIPEEMDGLAEIRRRLPWQTLATGEHWYGTAPFSHAAAHRLADVFQPDIQWVGGLTACLKICHLAEAAGIPVIPHAGMNTPYGQHLGLAMPSSPWGEFFLGTAPGVPLEEVIRMGESDNEPRCLSEGLRRVVDREVELHFHRVVRCA